MNDTGYEHREAQRRPGAARASRPEAGIRPANLPQEFGAKGSDGFRFRSS